MRTSSPQTHGEKMKKTTKRKMIARDAQRNSTETAITCHPYTSSGAAQSSDGVMRNFSSSGSYIETSLEYKSGTILIVRTLRYPPRPLSLVVEDQPRSICLAEVKWRQELVDEQRHPVWLWPEISRLNRTDPYTPILSADSVSSAAFLSMNIFNRLSSLKKQ